MNEKSRKELSDKSKALSNKRLARGFFWGYMAGILVNVINSTYFSDSFAFALLASGAVYIIGVNVLQSTQK